MLQEKFSYVKKIVLLFLPLQMVSQLKFSCVLLGYLVFLKHPTTNSSSTRSLLDLKNQQKVAFTLCSFPRGPLDETSQNFSGQ